MRRMSARNFPACLALDNVQFRLKRGTVHALMGENGAGKSTLMKILAGIYIPDQGEVYLKGLPIRLKSPLDALENGIAMIHQELNLMPFMTVAENIWIRREPKNGFGFVDHGKMYDMTADLFKRLECHARSGKPGSRPECGQPADGGNRQGRFLRIRCADHG